MSELNQQQDERTLMRARLASLSKWLAAYTAHRDLRQILDYIQLTTTLFQEQQIETKFVDDPILAEIQASLQKAKTTASELHSSTALEPPQVLLIGLDPYRVPGPWDPQPIVDAIVIGVTKFTKHSVPVRTCLFALDGSDNPVAMVTAALRSPSWKCVLIGGGIRKNEELLELFETIINLVRLHAPNAAIAFNKVPTDTFEAVARYISVPPLQGK